MKNLSFCLVWLAITTATICGADVSSVVVVDAPDSGQVQSRIIQELTLLGYRVVVVKASENDSRATRFTSGVVALIEIGTHDVEIWVPSDAEGLTESLEVARAPGMSDELLSLRAVELLQGKVLPTPARAKGQPDELPAPAGDRAEPEEPETRDPARSIDSFRFELGVGGGVTAIDGLPPAPTVQAFAAYRLGRHWRLGLWGDFPLSPVEVDFIGGGLRVWEIAYGGRLHVDWNLANDWALGAAALAGARHLTHDYEPESPFTPSSGTKAGPLIGVGIHSTYEVLSWLALGAHVDGTMSTKLVLIETQGVDAPADDAGPQDISSGRFRAAARMSVAVRW